MPNLGDMSLECQLQPKQHRLSSVSLWPQTVSWSILTKSQQCAQILLKASNINLHVSHLVGGTIGWWQSTVGVGEIIFAPGSCWVENWGREDKGGKGFAGRSQILDYTSPHLVSPPPKAQALAGLMEECSRLFHPPHRPRHHTVQHGPDHQDLMEEEKKNDCEVFADLPIFAAPRSQWKETNSEKERQWLYCISCWSMHIAHGGQKYEQGHPEQIAL